MGRIKTQLIKRLTLELLQNYKERFSVDFEENKKIAEELLSSSKKTRNAVAGYISRLMKHKEKV
jgi:small subunit ribosomal protein S17e